MFKVPSNIPQDLLLIHDLVSENVVGPSKVNSSPRKDAQESRASTNSISSSSGSESDSESDSEEAAVVENLLTKPDDAEEDGDVKLRSPSPSSSESSSDDTSSESGSDQEELAKSIENQAHEDVDEDEDEGGARGSSGSVFRTKHEVPEPSVAVPDITEVDTQEPLEKVGEIMSIIENVVVVKGLPSENENKASLRALDSESLLVFEDRKVLGFVYETFGPTHQPLYQVKFPSSAAIDRNVVTICREVFHVPPRSHFVFPSQLSKTKGSDASNVFDEEVNEDEIEFSDDEAEAAFRQRRKRKREGNRESSIASSRFSTPTPSQMRDQEVNDDSFFGASPYDEYGPYDMGVVPGPSRPAPLPYDDPYQDEYLPATSNSTQSREDQAGSPIHPRSETHEDSRGRGFGRGRGRSRGRGRGRGRGSTNRGGFGNSDRGSRPPTNRRDRRPSFSTVSNSDLTSTRSLSPTSMAIAQATGQFPDGSTVSSQQNPSSPSSLPASPHGFWQQQDIGCSQQNNLPQQTYGAHQAYQGQPQTYMQPHINPRFASLFGINMNFMQRQQYGPYCEPTSPQTNPYTPYSANASWANNTWAQNASNAYNQPDLSNEHTAQTKTNDDEYRP